MKYLTLDIALKFKKRLIINNIIKFESLDCCECSLYPELIKLGAINKFLLPFRSVWKDTCSHTSLPSLSSPL